VDAFFWFCVAFVTYAYAGYAVLLWVVSRFGRGVRRADVTPFVTFIIAARNERRRITAKIENTLSLEYPRECFEIIVASDCSDDGTNEIVGQYEDRGVRLVVAPERRGKEYAQSLAIQVASGQILVFSDAATRLEPDGVRRIVRNFADPTIGCVSSEDRLLGADGRPSGEGAYVRYEMLLRTLESKAGSVVGLSGSFFAARREVCHPWPVDLPSDFNTLLNTRRLGMRGISDPAAVGIYPDLGDPAAEYARKVRTITRGIRSLLRNIGILNPFRYGLFAWQLFSHKLCRWLVPFALAGAVTANLFLVQKAPLYTATGVIQLAVYGLSAYALTHPERQKGPVRLVAFFVLVNLSIVNAWYDVLRGRNQVTWQPSSR
jgi:glycosyltransferase involved in cell wall biosynthesis